MPNPLLRRFAWHVPSPLDIEAMRAALRGLGGRHDFSAFCAAPGRHVPPACTVRGLHIVRRKDRVALVVSADRFLHHMARNIVGSVVAVRLLAPGQLAALSPPAQPAPEPAR